MIQPSTPTWPVHRTFHVPYRDIDVLNHLNHATYFRFMETLRCDYYLPLLSSRDPRELDIIIAEATCRYLAPVSYDQEIVGEVAPARPLGRTSFSLLYRFRASEGTICARGRTVVVCYDYATSQKKEIPPERRKIMASQAIDPTTEDW